MEARSEIVGAPWFEVADAWAHFERERDSALDATSAAIRAFGDVGQRLSARRLNCATQAEFDELLAASTSIAPETARRAIATHEKLATGQIDLADHAAVRQLLVWTELMPEPEPSKPSPPQEVSWWMRTTSKLDGRIPSMTPDERDGLRRWCEATLQRLRG